MDRTIRTKVDPTAPSIKLDIMRAIDYSSQNSRIHNLLQFTWNI
jgi:hypothetical protein